jgi:hypothetical protein
MSAGKVMAAKMKVHAAPHGTAGVDGRFHVYVFDVFQRAFSAGRSFDTLERATQYQRHEQERIYAEQEATPELFDLPFISDDPDLPARIARDSEYRERLMRDLDAEARGRARGR